MAYFSHFNYLFIQWNQKKQILVQQCPICTLQISIFYCQLFILKFLIIIIFQFGKNFTGIFSCSIDISAFSIINVIVRFYSIIKESKAFYTTWCFWFWVSDFIFHQNKILRMSYNFNFLRIENHSWNNLVMMKSL